MDRKLILDPLNLTAARRRERPRARPGHPSAGGGLSAAASFRHDGKKRAGAGILLRPFH